MVKGREGGGQEDYCKPEASHGKLHSETVSKNNNKKQIKGIEELGSDSLCGIRTLEPSLPQSYHSLEPTALARREPCWILPRYP